MKFVNGSINGALITRFCRPFVLLLGTCLSFGNGYFEICKDADTPPELWWLKPLDPVYIRVRRDQYSNIFGYIQLLTFPPVPFEAEEIVHFINEPKSNWYECNYGTSELRPLLLIQAYIESLQHDLAIIYTVYTKPMLIVKGGTPEHPLPTEKMAALIREFKNRKPATDVVVQGHVEVKGIESMTRSINFKDWMEYLERQRKAILGVPEIFLGEPGGTNRATADTVMSEYITRLRLMQEIIGDELETCLFPKLLDAKFGPGTEVPKMKWKPIWNATLQELTPFYQMLLSVGAIGVGELRIAAGLPEKLTDEGDLASDQKAPSKPVQTKQSDQFGHKAYFQKDGKNWVVAEVISS